MDSRSVEQTGLSKNHEGGGETIRDEEQGQPMSNGDRTDDKALVGSDPMDIEVQRADGSSVDIKDEDEIMEWDTGDNPKAGSVRDGTVAINGNKHSPNAATAEKSTSPRRALAGKDLRRKNRRRLYRLLKNPEVQPSFLRVIEGRKKIKIEPGTEEEIVKKEKKKNEIDLLDDDDDTDDDFLLEPPMVVIDVDEFIGLKKKKLEFPEPILPAPIIGSNNAVVPTMLKSNTGVPPAVTSSSTTSSRLQHKYNPADDGWYEGTHPMSVMPDDDIHLSEIQKFVRDNMEYFSATEQDCVAYAGQRKTTVRGKVGIRCIHCAKAVQAATSRNGTRPKMPSGSVSYPVSFSAMYGLALQKPQQHFEKCPNLPTNLRDVFNSWKSGDSPGPRKRMKRGITSVAYWNISCHRLGIVELGNNDGLRFGRDLKLGLLPFDTVRAKLEQEQPGLFPKQYITSAGIKTTAAPGVSPVRVGSMNRVPTTPISLPKDVLDVLREAKAEEGDPKSRLIVNEDSDMLTDFMFLTVKQAAICHAVRADFSTRGKKTKLMRLGFAGFCCRHCKLGYSTGVTVAGTIAASPLFQNSCRSFSSSRDNIASAMSNSFVLHIQKCSRVPQKIKDALHTLKRVHPKQMQQLPYGSQSQFFAILFERIRAADKPIEHGISEIPDQIVRSTAKKEDPDQEYIPAIGSSPGMRRKARSSYRKLLTEQPTPTTVPSSVPVVNAEETRRVLKCAEETWVPSQNDNLILPQDRSLVSDFVFLCMRQLKIAFPSDADYRGNRKTSIVTRVAGLCCLHCSGTQGAMPSGRSFPSAADNIASSLNTSLYNHMLKCPRVPPEIKGTIDALRKIHSQQCSSLPFGSQRRYFKKLFARLKAVPVSQGGEGPNGVDFMKTLRKYSFTETRSLENTYWQCTRCRMVPYDYRVPGSLFFLRPPEDTLKKHFAECQKDDINWENIRLSMDELGKKYGKGKILVNMISFFEMVRSTVGEENEVIDTYMVKLGRDGQLPKKSYSTGIWRRLPTEVDFDEVQRCFSVLRKDLDLPPGNLSDYPDFLKFLQLLSGNIQVPLEYDKVENEEPAPASAVADETKQDFSVATLPKEENEKVMVDTQSKPIMDPVGTSSMNGSMAVMASTTETNHGMPAIIPKLSVDQGRTVMDQVESGQFDDP